LDISLDFLLCVKFVTVNQDVTDRNSCAAAVNGVGTVRGIIGAWQKFQRCRSSPALAHGSICATAV
jgi:hypothetical protein